MQQHSISILEDDKTFSHILASFINADESLQVSSIYHNCAHVVAQFPQAPTPIAIVDIQLPDGSGIDVVAKLKPLHPDTCFMMCTSFDDDEKIFASLKAGASGYIVKTDDPENIVAHIHDAINGGAPMSAGIALRVVKYFQQATPSPLAELTPKENIVLQQLSKGFLYKEIATQENITIDTIKKHCGNIYKKLHVNNKTEAINIYLSK
jgi:two-component system, NarL family, response regulator LiaR